LTDEHLRFESGLAASSAIFLGGALLFGECGQSDDGGSVDGLA
jgi:hypothetical protein